MIGHQIQPFHTHPRHILPHKIQQETSDSLSAERFLHEQSTYIRTQVRPIVKVVIDDPRSCHNLLFVIHYQIPLRDPIGPIDTASHTLSIGFHRNVPLVTEP